jgi:hypothetical protein
MTDMSDTDTTTVHALDPVILHAHWLVACKQLRAAHGWWSEAGADTRAAYYATVVAMMDQEEAAATVYARAVRRRAEHGEAESVREAARPHPRAGDSHTATLAADDDLVHSDAGLHRAG